MGNVTKSSSIYLDQGTGLVSSEVVDSPEYPVVDDQGIADAAPTCSFAEDNFVTAIESGALTKSTYKAKGEAIAKELLLQIKGQFVTYSKEDIKKQVILGAKVAFIKDPDMFTTLVDGKFYDSAKGYAADLAKGKSLFDIYKDSPVWQKKILPILGGLKTAHKKMLANVDGTMAAYEYQWKKEGKNKATWEIAKKQLYSETYDKAAEMMAAKITIPEELLDVEKRIAEYEKVELKKVEADVDKVIAEVVPEIGNVLDQIASADSEEKLNAALAKAETVLNNKAVMEKLALGVGNTSLMRLQEEITAGLEESKYLGIKMYPQTLANAELMLIGYDQKGANLSQLKAINKELKKKLTWVNDAKAFEGMNFSLGLFAINTMLLMASAGAASFAGELAKNVGGKVLGFIAETAAFTLSSQAFSSGITAMNLAFNKQAVTMDKLLPEGWAGVGKQYVRDLFTFGVLKGISGYFGKAMLSADEVAFGFYTSTAKGVVYETSSVILSAGTLYVTGALMGEGGGSFLETLLQLGILHAKGLGSKGEKGSLADGMQSLYEKAVIKAGEILSSEGGKKLVEAMPALMAVMAMIVGAEKLFSPEQFVGLIAGELIEKGPKSVTDPAKSETVLPEWLAKMSLKEMSQMFKKMASPIPEMDAQMRLDLYKLIPEEVKTDLTKTLEKSGAIWSFFEKLTQADFADKTKAADIEKMMKTWTDLAYDILDTHYLMSGIHPMFAVQRLMQEANSGRDAIVIRVDLDLKMINKLDESGALGNLYIPMVGEWFSKNIRSNLIYKNSSKWKPTVARTPEGTSLLIIGTNKYEGTELLNLIKGEFNNETKVFKSELDSFDKDIKSELLEAQANGMLDASLDLNAINFGATIFYSKIELAKLKSENATKDEIQNKIENDLAEVAAKTSWCKANKPDKHAQIEGFSVYSEQSLPAGETDLLYKSLQESIEAKRGYVPLGVYGYDKVLEGKLKAELEFPNISKKRSGVSSRYNGGGVVEKFCGAVKAMFIMSESQQAIENFKDAFLKLESNGSDAEWASFKNILKDLEKKKAVKYVAMEKFKTAMPKDKISKGGAEWENLKTAVLNLIDADAISKFQEIKGSNAWTKFKGELKEMGKTLSDLGEGAKRDPRYPALLKPERISKNFDGSYVNSDYFVEQVVLQNIILNFLCKGATFDKLLTVEVDGGSDFNRKFPPKDKTDGNFQITKKLFLETAEQLGMLPPVGAAEGDQIRFVISTTKMDGSVIDTEVFAKAYQKKVKDWYVKNGYIFQSTVKVKQADEYVELADGTFKLVAGPIKLVPVWIQKGTDNFVVAEKCPKVEGFVAFEKGVTVTVAISDLELLEPAAFGQYLNTRVNQLFTYIDNVLKHSSNSKGKPTYYKEGLGVLPKGFGKAAYHPSGDD